MTTFPTRILAGALLTGALSLGIAAPAFAQEDSGASRPGRVSVEDAKARCQSELERRQASLLDLEARVAGSAATDAHEATLAGIIDGTQSGLDGLSGQIAAATTAEELRAACGAIATEHRVYLVVAPQVHLTVGADRADVAVDRAGTALARLDEAIATAAASGADVSEAQGHRDAAAALIAEADAATDGLVDEVLAVTPASYNDGSGKAVIDDARSSLRDVRSDLASAGGELRAAVQALRALG